MGKDAHTLGGEGQREGALMSSELLIHSGCSQCCLQKGCREGARAELRGGREWVSKITSKRPDCYRKAGSVGVRVTLCIMLQDLQYHPKCNQVTGL